MAAQVTSTTVQRADLQRFRIITVLPVASPAGMVATAGAVPFKVLVAGKIKMIGLEEVKQSLGTRWEAMAARAMASAEHVTRRHRRRADRYLAACEALDTKLRERLVVVLSGIPKNFPKSRMLECVLRLRPFCHRIGFQSDGMEVPSVDGSLLSGAIVVLPEERLATYGAVDPEKPGRLIANIHAREAHALLRRVRKWDDLQPLAGIAIDLVSAIEDERDSEAAAG